MYLTLNYTCPVDFEALQTGIAEQAKIDASRKSVQFYSMLQTGIANEANISASRVIVQNYSIESPTGPCTLNVTMPQNATEFVLRMHDARKFTSIGGIQIVNMSNVELNKVMYLTLSKCPGNFSLLQADVANQTSISASRVIVQNYSIASPTGPCTLNLTMPQNACESMFRLYKDSTLTWPSILQAGIKIVNMSYDAPTPPPTRMPCDKDASCACPDDCSGHGKCNGTTASCTCDGGWINQSCALWALRARVEGTMSEFSSQPALIADGLGVEKCPANQTCLAKGSESKTATLTLDVVDVDSTPQEPNSDVTCTIKCNPAHQCATEDAEGKVVFKPGAEVAKAQLFAIVDYVDDGNQNVSVSIDGCSSSDPRFNFTSWKDSPANLPGAHAPSHTGPVFFWSASGGAAWFAVQMHPGSRVPCSSGRGLFLSGRDRLEHHEQVQDQVHRTARRTS
jgi:hypothetical protein